MCYDQTGYELSLYEKDGLQLQWRSLSSHCLRTAKGVGMSWRMRRANIASSTLIQQTKWVFGRCNFATHVKGDVQPSAQRLNPLKASKRSQRQGV